MPIFSQYLHLISKHDDLTQSVEKELELVLKRTIRFY